MSSPDAQNPGRRPGRRLSRQRRRIGIAAALAGCAAAILVAVTATFTAPGERDTVDATTADPVDIPARPATLGQERFRLALPYFRPHIRPAGAGFIVWTPYWSKDDAAPDIAAFDNAGAERWHYNRTGPDERLSRVGVYDDGRIVVVGFAGNDDLGRAPEMVGLDAVTGEQLWTSHDAAMWKALDINEGGSFASLMVRGKDSWTGFNARTGRQAWQIPNPAGCGAGPLETLSSLDEPYTVREADTTTHLVTVNDCSTPDTIRLRVLTHDPATGAQIADEPIPGADNQPRDTWENLRVDRAVNDSVSLTLNKACPRRPANGPCITLGERKHMLVNYLTGQSADLPPGSVYPSDDGRGDFVFAPDGDGVTYPGELNQDRTTDLMNVDRSLRCQYASQPWAGAVPTWLTDQFLIQTVTPNGEELEVRALNRDTCHLEVTLPWPVESDKKSDGRYIADSQGATLFVQTYDDSTAEIVGYTP